MYIARQREIEEDDAETQAEEDADASGEALGDVVGVVYAQRHDDAAERLARDDGPHDAVVADEEAAAGDGFAVDEDHPDEQRRKERVDGKLHVADPDGHLVRRLLEDLLKVHRPQRGGRARADCGREAQYLILERVLALYVLLDALIRGRALVQAPTVVAAAPAFEVVEGAWEVDARLHVVDWTNV